MENIFNRRIIGSLLIIVEIIILLLNGWINITVNRINYTGLFGASAIWIGAGTILRTIRFIKIIMENEGYKITFCFFLMILGFIFMILTGSPYLDGTYSWFGMFAFITGVLILFSPHKYKTSTQ